MVSRRDFLLGAGAVLGAIAAPQARALFQPSEVEQLLSGFGGPVAAATTGLAAKDDASLVAPAVFGYARMVMAAIGSHDPASPSLNAYRFAGHGEPMLESLDDHPRRVACTQSWCDRISPEFRQRVGEIAERLGSRQEWLLAVMAFESASTFSPGIRNGGGSGATGIIQFMPSTADWLGTSTDALARMNQYDQLEWVEKYFQGIANGRPLNSLRDTYMAVLWPAAIGRGPDYALFRSPSVQYRQNAGLDVDGDGVVTAGEATAKVEPHLQTDRSGAYLISSDDWDRLRGQYRSWDGSGFTPANQDAAFLYLTAESNSHWHLRNAIERKHGQLWVDYGHWLRAVRRDTRRWPQISSLDEAWEVFAWEVWGIQGLHRHITFPVADQDYDSAIPSRTSRYGWRQHPISGDRKLHKGDDYGYPTGTALVACEDSEVVLAGVAGGYGNTVVLRSNRDPALEVLYAHCHTLNCQQGQQIKAGDVVATVGSTGLSTGPHLHFEVHWCGQALNPRRFLQQSVWFKKEG